MSVVTVQKPFDEIETLVRDARSEKLWILGCGKCGKVSQTGGATEVIAMRQRLADHPLASVPADGAPLVVEQGACDPEAVEVAAEALRRSGFDTVLVLACGAGLKCIQDALPHVTLLPGLNTLGPGVNDKLACLSCGDCKFAEGRCRMLAVVDETRARLSDSYASRRPVS